MKCDICRERIAVIFVQQVSRDSTIELHLCEQCAKERGLSSTENRIDISLGGVFSELFEKKHSKKSGDEICPSCGCSFADIKKIRKTGCARCYSLFKTGIVSLLRQEGIESAWQGTTQSQAETEVSAPIDIDSLKRELKKAVTEENYELAAYYRDRIKSFSGGTQ